MVGLGASHLALRAASDRYQAAAQDAGLAFASEQSATGSAPVTALTTVAETAAELMVRLAPPEPHLGANVDIRV